MGKLKLTSIEEDKPVKATIELAASVHRDLIEYASALATQSGQPSVDPIRLISPMLQRFMESDREFRRMRKINPH